MSLRQPRPRGNNVRASLSHAPCAYVPEALERRVLLSVALTGDVNRTPVPATNGTASSWPSFVGTIGNTAFFFADDGSHGFELWKSDGTPGGASLVKDIRPGSAGSVEQFGAERGATVGGVLYFAADNGTNGRELWRTDGTAAGTRMVKNIFADTSRPTGSKPRYLTEYHGALYFVLDDDSGLYRSDGTEAGTVYVKNIGASAIWGVVNDRLLIAVNGWELWASNGTADGTVLLKGPNAGNGYPDISGVRQVTPTMAMFFAADGIDPGNKLWKTDGTPAGTVLVTDAQPGTDDWYAGGLAASGGKYYWGSNYGVAGEELWVSDGTAQGTHLVKDIYPGPGASRPNSLTDLNGIVLFSAATPTATGFDIRLWRSDGTESGTYPVKDVFPEYSAFSGTSVWARANDVVYFGGSADGRKSLWKTNGTADGTVVAANVPPGTLLPAGQSLFFTGDDGTTGMEVWHLTPGDVGPRVIDARLESPDGAPHRAVFRFDEAAVPTVRDGVAVLTLRSSGEVISRGRVSRVPGGPADVATFVLPGPDGNPLPPGAYRVTLPAGSVSDADGDPQPSERFIDFDVNASVVGRHLFYDNSAFDNSPFDPSSTAPPLEDKDAIAPDKRALLPGESATFDNVSSYSRGINGVMIDVSRLPMGGSPTQDDLEFSVGDGTTWSAAPPLQLMLVQRNAGAGGSDRLVLKFADGAITNTWLRVTLKTGFDTLLAAPDVFYFGSLVGETGNGGPLSVNAIDLGRVRAAQLTAAPLTSRFDFNRDGRVNAVDLGICRAAQLHALPSLTAPPMAPPSAALAREDVATAWL